MNHHTEPTCFCMECGYPLHGLPEDRCPECGREFDRNDPGTYRVAGQKRWGILRQLFIHPIYIIGPVCLAFLFLPCLAWPLLVLSVGLGLIYIFKGRWSGLILVLLNPGSLMIAFAVAGYLTGTGSHAFLGSGRPEIYNVHAKTRLPWEHRNDYYPFNNFTLDTLGRLFGPAVDSYAGHYLTRNEALHAIKDAKPIDLDELIQHNRITVDGATVSLWPDVCLRAIGDSVYHPANADLFEDNKKEIIQKAGVPVAALYDQDCLVLKIPYTLILEPEEITGEEFCVLMIETRKGRVFGGHYNGYSRPKGWWPLQKEKRWSINASVFGGEVLLILAVCLVMRKKRKRIQETGD